MFCNSIGVRDVELGYKSYKPCLVKGFKILEGPFLKKSICPSNLLYSRSCSVSSANLYFVCSTRKLINPENCLKNLWEKKLSLFKIKINRSKYSSEECSTKQSNKSMKEVYSNFLSYLLPPDLSHEFERLISKWVVYATL